MHVHAMMHAIYDMLASHIKAAEGGASLRQHAGTGKRGRTCQPGALRNLGEAVGVHGPEHIREAHRIQERYCMGQNDAIGLCSWPRGNRCTHESKCVF